jgi:salicylate hydroxylase
LFDQVHDEGAIEARLRLFERVRRKRASALQILSSTSPPAPQSVRDAAAQYLPGTKLNSTDDVDDYVFSFDVIAESKAVLASS